MDGVRFISRNAYLTRNVLVRESISGLN